MPVEYLTWRSGRKLPGVYHSISAASLSAKIPEHGQMNRSQIMFSMLYRPGNLRHTLGIWLWLDTYTFQSRYQG